MNDEFTSAGVVYLGLLLDFFVLAVGLEQRHRPARAVRWITGKSAAPVTRRQAAAR
ncbi:hypothetical protein [Roseomonas elaeocarpi]|uniref:Uncharacterized protein n=1 Tax=Roseomonas elaeocarpi TaxID=907779 RepID=A0ABV6JTS4_9PROT